MAEAAVGAVVGASIRILLQNLLSVSSEISLVRAFNKDLENLKDSFLMIQDFLDDAEKQQITNRAVNRWLKKLESLAFEADSVFDELNYHLLSKKIETQNTMKKKVQSFFSHSNPIALRRKIGHKIRDISKKLELINQEASSFGLQIRLAGARDPGVGSDAPASPGTDSFSVDPIVLGRENDVSRIVEMLTTNPNEQVFKIVPILGMGGLGKTTLARLVFGDEQIKNHFEHCIWVHVSRNFNVLMIFKNILASLTTENVELGNREVLLKKLQKDLGAKRYLLVLDDVWNEETEKWDDFVNSLLGISSVRGHGIIVTTRSERVASVVKTLPIHELKSLSEDNCWSIIKAKAFRTGDVPLEFETMGENIAKRCQGLPLAAKVVGGLLRGKSKDEWLSVEQSWLSDFGGDGNTVLKILKLSFDHLSSPSLKKCFAYCSIFPKGAYMEREELIELWMAEGFLQTDQKTDMETVGIKFLGILLENSLLQVVERDLYGNITYCNMHDLVHDLACSVLNSKSICLNNNNILDDIYQVRYIGREYIRDESCPIPKEQARCLRTLFFVGRVSDIIFSELKCLHVLILMGRDVKELPSMIRELIHLRYLDISYTRIECFPDSIGELYHLQTLRAVTDDESEYYLTRLPTTLKSLISLKHLHIPDIQLPPEMGRLISLETLPYFKVGREKGYGIVELGSMKNLKGKLEIHGLENVHGKEDAMSAYLFQKRNIFKLKFVWDESREGETNDEDVLEGLQPHPNLKSLEIYGFKGKNLPLWTLKMVVRDDLEGRWLGLNNLMEIKLTSCQECEEMPMLGHLPHLKYLYLCRLTNVRSIGTSFYGIDSSSTSSSSNIGVRKKDTITIFRALERLELSEMSNLTEWVEVELSSAAETQAHEVMVFPCLEYVKIDNCRLLTSAPSHFPCLKEFEISGMDSGVPLANICGIKLISLTKLKIERLDGLVCLPNELFNNNQNLSHLEIRDCPYLATLLPCFRGAKASLRELLISNCSSLRELPNDLHSLNSLKKLSIFLCPNLKSIPYPSVRRSQGFFFFEKRSQGFASLRHFEIGGCEGLTNLPCEMMDSCAPSIEQLSLFGLTSLTNLPTVIGRLHKLPHLTTLSIFNVPKCANFVKEIGSLNNLQELCIGYSSDSWKYGSFKETIDGIIGGLQSLRRLSLYGIEYWDTIPDKLQNLTSLLLLALYGFGIEALPEWLGNLSSLGVLYLYGCEKLRHLPSKEAMRRLTKLTELHMIDCPMLKQRCIVQESDEDSEWSKISHIPQVYM